MSQRINISARYLVYSWIEQEAAQRGLPIATTAEQLLFEHLRERNAPTQPVPPTVTQHTTRPKHGQGVDASTFGMPGRDQRERSRPGEPLTPDEDAQVTLETKGPAYVRRLLAQDPPHWNKEALARVLAGE